MAHKKADLVQETSTSTGTGAMALAGAPTRRSTFSAVLSDGDTCYVLIENAAAAEWEICLATYTAAGNTLSRGAVKTSSTGSTVSFSAGTKTISLVAPAANAPVEDNNGDVSVTRDLSVGGHVRTTAPRTITAATGTVGETDTDLIVNFAGTCTLTLPAAASYTGRSISVKTITANTVVSASSNVVPRAGGAAATAVLAAAAGNWARLVSDGSNWIVMAGS